MLTLADCTPGRPVECINSTGSPELTERAVYTIAEAVHGVDRLGSEGWGVSLQELRAPIGYAAFACRRFRLLPDERLAVFRAMLAPIRERADATR